MLGINWKFSRRCVNLLKKGNLKSNFSTSESRLSQECVEEIQIPVPWGHVAAKWHGVKSKQPILCCHGWQDNANSFNPLIPHLLPEYSYLAIDLPGHGLSSHFPKGHCYRTYEIVSFYRRIQAYFNWPKISYVGHSFGAVCGFLFSSCFPHCVDFLVAIDTIKPLSRDPARTFQKGSEILEQFLLYDSHPEDSAPRYNKADLMKRWIEGSGKSLTEKSCEILMERGVEEKDGLFTFRRDIRVKSSVNPNFNHKEILKMADSVKCNLLFIKAKDFPYFEKKEYSQDVLDRLKKGAKYFEYCELPGTHHLHMNNPEAVGPVINAFIQKVKKDSCQN